MNDRLQSTVRSVIPAALLMLALPPLASAADDAGVPGAFLRYGTSARGLAVGNAVVGLADDVSTSYWNPAGLAQLRTMELGAMGATLFEDTQYTYLSLGFPTEGLGTFGLSGAFQQTGGFERATLFEDLNESFSQSQNYFALSYARGSGRFSWGVSLKTTGQNIGGASGSGVGADVGLYMRPVRALSLGFAIQNAIAPEILLDEQAETLARSIRGGAALRFFNNRLLVLSDLIKTDMMDTAFQAGLEAWPSRSFSLRSGYDTVNERLSWGAGFRHENWQVDYTFLDHDLGATNVISATFRFGVPWGVKMAADRSLFSPSGEDREVHFDIDTAVRARVESWTLKLLDDDGQVVRTLGGHGTPPDGVTWSGDDDDGRLVADGTYHAEVMIVDSLGEEWDYGTSVQIMGFHDRTRTPIRIDIGGSATAEDSGERDR